jgi:hypothetical protein
MRIFVKIMVGCLILSACSGSASQLPSAPTSTSDTASGAGLIRDNLGTWDDHHVEGSWILPEAKSEDLLYESDISWASVYTYPQGKIVGKLKDFYLAAGQCVDNTTGGVYIADYGRSRVYKYSHGSSQRKSAYFVPGAADCAIDPTTGNLAVASWAGAGIWIFANATGKPTKYLDSDFIGYYSCGYDSKGNLYVDGISQVGDGHVVLAELSKGRSQLETVKVAQYLGWPAGVKWDGKRLAVGDGATPVVYQFVIKGRRATRVGATQLGTGLEYMHNFWIQTRTLLASGQCYHRCYGVRSNQAVMFFNYPGGGTATKLITEGIKASAGDSVSLAPKPRGAVF